MSASYKLMFLLTVLGCGSALWMTANGVHVDGEADRTGEAELAINRLDDDQAGGVGAEVVKPVRLQSLSSGAATPSTPSVGSMGGSPASPRFQSQAPAPGSGRAERTRAVDGRDVPPPVKRFTPDGIIPVDPLITRSRGPRQAPASSRSVDLSPAPGEPAAAARPEEPSLWSTPDEPASAEPVGAASSRSPSVSAASLGERRHTIGPGDTFESIALRYLGSRSMWVAISQANPMVDPVRLKPGDVVRIPDQAEIQRFGHQNIRHPDKVIDYVVRPGDTLSTIAKRFYDNPTQWRVIFNANRERIGANPNRMQAGTRLVIPPAP